MATTAAGNRTPLPDTSHFRRQAFIDGEFVDAASGATFECVSPVSGDVLFEVAACDSEDVDHAVAVARRTSESGAWSQVSPRKRRSVPLSRPMLMVLGRATHCRCWPTRAVVTSSSRLIRNWRGLKRQIKRFRFRCCMAWDLTTSLLPLPHQRVRFSAP